MSNNIVVQFVINIISEQEGIIGPLAVEQAQKVKGLNVDWPHKEVSITGDVKKVLESLVIQYEKIFGQTSIEVCREIAHSMEPALDKSQIPSLLL